MSTPPLFRQCNILSDFLQELTLFSCAAHGGGRIDPFSPKAALFAECAAAEIHWRNKGGVEVRHPKIIRLLVIIFGSNSPFLYTPSPLLR
jgi:hypothetical protein